MPLNVQHKANIKVLSIVNPFTALHDLYVLQITYISISGGGSVGERGSLSQRGTERREENGKRWEDRRRHAASPHSSFKLSWMSYSYKLVKMLSVCVSCLDVCLDVNQSGTNRNRCIQRLVILHAQTQQWTLITHQKEVTLTYFPGLFGHHGKYLYVYYLYMLLTYSHQICNVGTTDICTDRFTSGLIYFSRSQGSKCKN